LLKSTSARKTFAPYQQLQQFNPPRSKQSSSYQSSPQRSSSSAEDSILSHNAIPLPHKTTNSHFSTKFKHPAALFSQNTEKRKKEKNLAKNKSSRRSSRSFERERERERERETIDIVIIITQQRKFIR